MSDRPPDTDPEGHATPDPTVPIDSLATSGSTLGPFLLRERIGAGGMGEVWKAEQTSPVRRTVALKLIKAGMDSREVLARFEAERQALALMDHPCIAKVFDAGTTPQGRPWFAMEYVRGIPITEYCDKHRLSTTNRLQLFQHVCEGVQHAHQKAVLHRDLKPGNILVADVDEKPLPKIIDFGVAKATTQKLTEKTMYTAMGQLIGTPEYMSPEQAELTGEDVDTRTDVYSLGVVLYELLVGALPFEPKELRKAGFEGIRKMIREQDPPRPSTKLSTLGDQTTEIATYRGTGPKHLSSQLKGDLDWIVMRCLEKDRNRRYGSPQELGRDIQRHMDHEPVQAGPPSAGYRARKFVRRNRLGVGIAAATLAVLMAFTATMAVQSQRIAKERDRANQEAEASERVSAFLADMLGDVDAHRMGTQIFESLVSRARESRALAGSDLHEIELMVHDLEATLTDVDRSDLARQLLDEEILARALSTIEQDEALPPLIAARLLQTVGVTYRELGLFENAETTLRSALDIHERELGEEAVATLAIAHDLGMTLREQKNLEEAETLLTSVVDARGRALGEEHLDSVDSQFELAITLHSLHRYEEMHVLVLGCLEILESQLGTQHPRTLRAMNMVADGYAHHGQIAAADSLLRVAFSAARSAADLDSLDRAQLQWGMITPLMMAELYPRAVELARGALGVFQRIQGSEHPAALMREGVLAELLAKMGDAEAAIETSRRAMETAVNAHGPRSAVGLRGRWQHVLTLHGAGRGEEALQVCEGLLEDQRRVLGAEHRDTINSLVRMAWISWGALKRPAEAASYYEEVVEILERTEGPEDPWTINVKHFLAVCYMETERLADAESLLVELVDLRRRVFGETHERTSMTYYRLGNLYRQMGRDEDAAQMYAECVDIARRLADAPDPDPSDLNNYVYMLLEIGDLDFGLGIRDPEMALHYAKLANEKTENSNPDYLDTLATVYAELGRLTDAVETQRRALSLMPDSHPNRGEYEGRLKDWEAEHSRASAD